jgi:hypothetical protein
MRKLLLVGTAGLVLALGTAGASAQSVLDRVESSPRALQAQDIGSQLRAPNVGVLLTEGRSAYVGETGGLGPQNNGNGSIKNAAPITQQFDTFRVR